MGVAFRFLYCELILNRMPMFDEQPVLDAQDVAAVQDIPIQSV
jgi:hypothetical protein